MRLRGSQALERRMPPQIVQGDQKLSTEQHRPEEHEHRRPEPRENPVRHRVIPPPQRRP